MFHSTLRQRLRAIHTLRFQHKITTLCRVLKVNRSTYYKHFSSKPAHRTIENQKIRITILEIYSRSKKDSVLLIFHSDRGSQYAGKDFRRFCDENNIVQSFSKKGYPWDNSVVESFFKYLKKEELNRKHFQKLEDVKLVVFQYIEGFYNSQRPHSTN